MATFPALNPATRIFTPPTAPLQSVITMTGVYDATLLASSPRDARIELTFIALSTANKDLIVNHYDGQDSEFTAFDLPSAVFSGHTAGNYITAGYLWRYDSSPEVKDISSAQSSGCVVVHDVTVSLISEVTALMFVAGADLRLSVGLAAGATTASSAAPAADLTITLSLAAGAATAS